MIHLFALINSSLLYKFLFWFNFDLFRENSFFFFFKKKHVNKYMFIKKQGFT